MAMLPLGKDGSQWAIVCIGTNVAIISNPGYDSIEVVHFKYDGRSQEDTLRVKTEVLKSTKLTDEQKFYTGFWMGYFYAYLSEKGV